ncbi:MAG TPA: alpha/beta hydrolase [Blastocatellia bacterium]|nr:alpha/beta hydrolase [Blastocatellia bacterium]
MYAKEKHSNKNKQLTTDHRPLTTLIYIAGLDGTGELLFKQISELARSYRVVTFRSRDSGRFTYEDLTDDVAAIIRQSKETRAIILGESFGGTVAMMFALRYPQMVERLVVVNSFPRFRKRLKIRLAAWLASVLPFRLLWPVRFAACALGLHLDGVSRDDRRRFFKAIRTVKKEGYARRLQLIAELNIEDRLSEIEAPTLFIAGEKDLLVSSAKEARRMAARMRNATVKIIKGAGHACLLGNRVHLAELLNEWRAVESASRK